MPAGAAAPLASCGHSLIMVRPLRSWCNATSLPGLDPVLLDTRRSGRTMWGMAMALPRRPLTVEDLAELPDDDHRYELIDGSLLVTPAPGTAHQLALGRLHTLLSTAITEGLVAILAPYDYVITPTTVLEPDLMVVRAEQLGGDKLTSTPLLVVEILSPSTRRTDLGSKRLAYQDAGVPAYWVLDPATAALTVHDLDTDGTYRATIVTPPDSWVDSHLGVTIDPGVLCRPAI